MIKLVEHSIEEIRAAALTVLKNNLPYYRSERTPGYHQGIHEFLKLRMATAAEINRTEGNGSAISPIYDQHYLDQDTFVEVFWELFRDGTITLGRDERNVQFPYFRLTKNGMRFLEDGQEYFLKDLEGFESQIKDQIPQIDAISMLYLKESMSAFRSGCRIASAVMLGVAAEHIFLTLVEAIKASPPHALTFKKVIDERQISGKINAFKRIVDSRRAEFKADLLEGYETQFLGIQELIRVYRNENGHPTGIIPAREQAYVNIQLFIPFCKKVFGFMAHFH